jgi:hypothetical protein
MSLSAISNVGCDIDGGTTDGMRERGGTEGRIEGGGGSGVGILAGAGASQEGRLDTVPRPGCIHDGPFATRLGVVIILPRHRG